MIAWSTLAQKLVRCKIAIPNFSRNPMVNQSNTKLQHLTTTMNIISIPVMHLNVQMKKDISNNCDEQFSIDVHHLIPFALHFMQNGFAICYSAKVKLHFQIDLDLVLLHPLHFVENRCKDDGREKKLSKRIYFPAKTCPAAVIPFGCWHVMYHSPKIQHWINVWLHSVHLSLGSLVSWQQEDLYCSKFTFACIDIGNIDNTCKPVYS